MKATDLTLVARFLIREFDSFAEYLDDCSIEPTEAEVIIEDLLKAAESCPATCIEQFNGLNGE